MARPESARQGPTHYRGHASPVGVTRKASIMSCVSFLTSSLCPWCAGSNEDVDAETLCRMHVAEYLGTSLDQLDREEREQAAEWADTRN
jgi:hypothetical protein